MNKFLSLMLVMTVVACGSASPKEEAKTQPTNSSSGSGSSDPTIVDSGSDTSFSGSGSGSGSGSIVPPVVDAGHDAEHMVEVDAGHVVVVDAGHVVEVDAGHDAGSCALPSGTYNYVFTNVTANCDNTLGSYMVGPVPLGSVTLATLLPSFCDQSGDTPVVSADTASSNGCSATATTTCSDLVHATLPDGGSDPLTIISVATIDANTTANVLSGTLSLTTADEVSKASCTQTYTWKATATQ